MLTHPTLDQLNQLGLFGMAKAFVARSSRSCAALPLGRAGDLATFNLAVASKLRGGACQCQSSADQRAARRLVTRLQDLFETSL
jgi:hypothetical protein